MRPFAIRPAAPLAALICLVPGWAQAPAAQADWAGFLAPFPAAGSEAGHIDAAIVLWAQRTRGAAAVARAKSEVKLDPGAFSEALGRPLDSAGRPRTRELLEAVGKELRSVTDPLKKAFARPRPYDADPSLKPAVDPEPSYSYPSGHATRGMAWALLLAELAPERREALLERGREIGTDRVLGGVHYPSDIEAGQRLGGEWARRWLADPGNRRRLEEVRSAEWRQETAAGHRF